MAKPKLALIPAAQGSKFYSVLPSSGVGDFNFTRSGSATRINSQGLIETVASGVSRLNYPMIDGVVKGCPHHILEPQRTNLIQYSEDFSNAAWLKTGLTVDTNKILSPYGSLDADEVNITTANAHYLFDTISVSALTNYTFTFYVKKGTATDVSYSILNEINFTNIINTTSYFNEISDTEWTRISVEFTTPSGCTSIRTYPLRDGLSIGTVYIWGAQLEQSYATSYIPTNGSVVTRSAETANGSGDVDTFNDSEGVLMVETKFLQDGRMGISNSDNSDQVIIGNSDGIFYRITENNSNPITQYIGVSEYENHKIALKYKSTETSIFVDGFELDTNNASYSLGGLDKLSFAAQSSAFYGNTKQIQYFETALTDSELETLTSWVSFTDMAEGQLYKTY